MESRATAQRAVDVQRRGRACQILLADAMSQNAI